MAVDEEMDMQVSMSLGYSILFCDVYSFVVCFNAMFVSLEFHNRHLDPHIFVNAIQVVYQSFILTCLATGKVVFGFRCFIFSLFLF